MVRSKGFRSKGFPRKGYWAQAALAVIVLANVSAPRLSGAEAPALTITLLDGKSITLGAAEIEKLPHTVDDVSFATEHGPQHAVFDGPLLWAVLDQSGAFAGMGPRQQIGHVAIVTGRDGYQADIALGEISPEFEGKPVILAERKDGAALGEGHLRLIVPGDRHGGRDVQNVVSITLR